MNRRCLLFFLCWFGFPAAATESPIRIASKNFNESYLLAEISAQHLEAQGFVVERRFGLGGTLICYEALKNNEIDLYIEYTGTLAQAILKQPHLTEPAQINSALGAHSLALLAPLGFNNTYAMVMPRELAQSRSIVTLDDLAEQTDLKVVVSHEFLQREDGWPGLAKTYHLPQSATGIEHGLAYQAISDGAIDVTDAYSTDGELKRYDLQVLTDTRSYFPEYLAVPLIRKDLPTSVQEALTVLAGRLNDDSMQNYNSAVVFDKRSFAAVAQEFLRTQKLVNADAKIRDVGILPSLLSNTAQHLKLTVIALIAAIVVGLTTSLLIFRHAALARSVMYLCGLMQTIPSIALLALMIPWLGIGMAPAIVALFLYSLLPIVRSTVTALTTVDPVLIKVARAMGLSEREQLRHVYLPLSMPSALAGIRTAAVISIGTATLAAFIGAGGLGEPIVTGLSLNDTNLILQGAIPAALLAVVTELLFEGVERWVLPGHLRAV